ncbi:hypothetical protein [Mycobacterium lepromatosis]|uniref:hypothetical protein n=1 Tax=Mycobacterium lepromatosis TaxID=480418 RepID=UPI000A7883C0|nr:hypothetical protein [Mycobacterium lepromatosis]
MPPQVSGWFAPAVPEPVVEHLTELAASSRALEFAFGTSRVAILLAGRGASVTGIKLMPRDNRPAP